MRTVRPARRVSLMTQFSTPVGRKGRARTVGLPPGTSPSWRARRGRRHSSRPRRGLAEQVDVRPRQTRPPAYTAGRGSDASKGDFLGLEVFLRLPCEVAGVVPTRDSSDRPTRSARCAVTLAQRATYHKITNKQETRSSLERGRHSSRPRRGLAD